MQLTLKVSARGTIKGKAEGCDSICDEGYSSIRNEEINPQNYDVPFESATGTGGIVGHQDVNATRVNGNWQRTDETTGVYNCYGSGDVTGAFNVGGLVGLAVGDWTNNREFPERLWSSQYGAPNAAYVKIYSSVSDGNVSAKTENGNGIAGGVVGYSVMAEIKGSSVSATVTCENNATGPDGSKGRAAGISAIYMPSFARHVTMGGDIYAEGKGFLMEGAIVDQEGITPEVGRRGTQVTNTVASFGFPFDRAAATDLIIVIRDASIEVHASDAALRFIGGPPTY